MKFKIMHEFEGFRGRRERFLNKILLVLKSFHPVLPIRKVKTFEKTTYHYRSQNESRHSCQDPPSLMQFLMLYNLIWVPLTGKPYRRSYCTNNVLGFFSSNENYRCWDTFNGSRYGLRGFHQCFKRF